MHVHTHSHTQTQGGLLLQLRTTTNSHKGSQRVHKGQISSRPEGCLLFKVCACLWLRKHERLNVCHVMVAWVWLHVQYVGLLLVNMRRRRREEEKMVKHGNCGEQDTSRPTVFTSIYLWFMNLVWFFSCGKFMLSMIEKINIQDYHIKLLIRLVWRGFEF